MAGRVQVFARRAVDGVVRGVFEWPDEPGARERLNRWKDQEVVTDYVLGATALRHDPVRIVRSGPQPIVGIEPRVVGRFGDAELLDVRVRPAGGRLFLVCAASSKN